jgi:hypothetical protein
LAAGFYFLAWAFSWRPAAGKQPVNYFMRAMAAPVRSIIALFVA